MPKTYKFLRRPTTSAHEVVTDINNEIIGVQPDKEKDYMRRYIESYLKQVKDEQSENLFREMQKKQIPGDDYRDREKRLDWLDDKGGEYEERINNACKKLPPQERKIVKTVLGNLKEEAKPHFENFTKGRKNPLSSYSSADRNKAQYNSTDVIDRVRMLANFCEERVKNNAEKDAHEPNNEIIASTSTSHQNNDEILEIPSENYKENEKRHSKIPDVHYYGGRDPEATLFINKFQVKEQ